MTVQYLYSSGLGLVHMSDSAFDDGASTASVLELVGMPLCAFTPSCAADHSQQ